MRAILFAFLWFITVNSIEAQVIRATADNTVQSVQAAGKAPSVDSILERYINALGGETAIKNISSRISTGTVVIFGRSCGNIEIAEKATDKIVTLVTSQCFVLAPVYRWGFDGKIAWSDSVLAKGPATSEEEKDGLFYLLDLHFLHPLKFRELRQYMNYGGKAQVGESETYAVVLSFKGIERTLYFDIQTGLLLATGYRANIDFFYEIDYLNYRKVDGVMIPFERREWEGGDLKYLIRLTEIKHNSRIDDEKFTPPAPHDAFKPGLERLIKPLSGPPVSAPPPSSPLEEFNFPENAEAPAPKPSTTKGKRTAPRNRKVGRKIRSKSNSRMGK
jgi:hypothetical protein